MATESKTPPSQNIPLGSNAGHMVTQPPVELVQGGDDVFLDLDSIPWTPFPVPGNYFKLLHVDEVGGGFTFYLKTDADAPPLVHKHVGGALIYNIKGHWQYEGYPEIGPNYFLYEPSGVIHQPLFTEFAEENEMIIFMHGCIVGYNEDGITSGVIDADLMYELAEANGAAGHLPRARRGR